jgi:hypothetical protein
MKISLTFGLLLLFLFACQKDDNTINEPTIDWPTFSHALSWTEIASKTGESAWKNISEGQKMTFFSNSVDEELGMPNNGVVLYKPNLNIHIKNNTSFQRTGNLLEFYYYPNTAQADTINLTYELLDSSTLVISDTTVKPVVQIKFSRDK